MRKATLLAFVLTLAFGAASAGAQTGSRILLQPFRPTDQIEVNADAMYLITTQTDSVDGSASNFDFRADVYDFEGRIRLTPATTERGIARAQPRAGFDSRYIQLHTSDPALPDEMFDASFAVGMGVLARGGWIGGISVGAGYAGADFESDANAPYYQAVFALGRTYKNGDVLGIVLEYNGNRTFLPDWPLVGFQFRTRLDRPRPISPPDLDEPATQPDVVFERYDPSADPPRLLLAVGFPYSQLEWHPTDRLRLELVYSAPATINARIDFTLAGDPQTSGVGVYGSLNRTVTAVHWNELPGSDRLFFRQVLVEAGVIWRVHDRLELIVAGGYAFDQEFDSGWDTRDTQDVADIDDTPYIRALARLRL